MESIGVRELRQNASKYLAEVEAGACYTITDRGRPVAVLAPGWEVVRVRYADLAQALVRDAIDLSI